MRQMFTHQLGPGPWAFPTAVSPFYDLLWLPDFQDMAKGWKRKKTRKATWEVQGSFSQQLPSSDGGAMVLKPVVPCPFEGDAQWICSLPLLIF